MTNPMTTEPNRQYEKYRRAAEEYRALKGGDDVDCEAFEVALEQASRPQPIVTTDGRIREIMDAVYPLDDKQ